jgi:hypothetical protein
MDFMFLKILDSLNVNKRWKGEKLREQFVRV